MLEEVGLPIVDADLVARIVVEPGTPTLEKISEVFGKEVLLENGELNREKLGEIIFHNPAKRVELNSIMHPAIRQEMLRQRDELTEAGEPHIVMDIPLLFESHLQHFVEKILVVSVTEENQLTRLMERNHLSKEEALARIATQLPLSEKEKGADAVIYNNRDLENTRTQLLAILKEWDII
ncbi:dephospho-CoA kinase [Rummeliibacillus sp. G93]|nr:dephospho-CoA kinase [Rummeliibacillus sp. G93]